MGDNLDGISSILRIPASYRSNANIETLVSLTKENQFFKKISAEQNSNDVHYECCKAMNLEEYSEGDIIFNYGEKGDKFYIILSGSVSIQLPSKRSIMMSKQTISRIESFLSLSSDDSESDSSDEREEIRPFQRRLTRFTVNLKDLSNFLNTPRFSSDYSLNKSSILTNDEKDFLLYINKKPKEVQKYLIHQLKNHEKDHQFELEIDDFTEIGVLFKGASFGELALISDKPRSAKIEAKERSSFLVLNKSDFTKILGDIAEKKLNSLVRFLQMLKFFESKSKSYLIKLAYYFHAKRFKKNQVIFKEGEETDGIYFVREGQVIIMKKTEMRLAVNPTFSSSPKNFSKPKTSKKNYDAKIVIKEKLESFGGYDVVENKDQRSYSSLCFSEFCEVLFISKLNFLTRVTNLEPIRDELKLEQDRIEKRFVDVQETNKSIFQIPRNLTPTFDPSFVREQKEKEKSKKLGSINKYFPNIKKKSSPSFLRKLTGTEIYEAVYGRSSIMRKYKKKLNMDYSFEKNPERHSHLSSCVVRV